jgi:hypothetical protein
MLLLGILVWNDNDLDNKKELSWLATRSKSDVANPLHTSAIIMMLSGNIIIMSSWLLGVIIIGTNSS